MLRRSISTGSPATLLTLILVLSLLLLTACGDDDDDSTNDSPAGSTATTVTTSSTAATPADDQDDDDDADDDADDDQDDDDADDQDDDDQDDDDDDDNGDGPCSLLTADEVAAAVGEDVLDTDSISVSDDMTLGNCTYNIVPEGSFKVVSVFNHGSAVDASVFAAPAGAQDIEGFGDDAHWDSSLHVLTVRHDDDDYFTVQIATASDDAAADLEIAKELATKILERL